MKRQTTRMTLEEALSVLSGAAKGDLYIGIEELPNGKYVLPDGFIANALKSDGSGAVDKGESSTFEEEDTPAVNTDAQITVPADETWEVSQAYASIICDANAGNRTSNVSVAPPIRNASPTFVLTECGKTDNVVTAATEEGLVLVTEGDIYINVAGTITHENSTFLPVKLPPGSTIDYKASGKKAGDFLGLSVMARKVA